MPKWGEITAAVEGEFGEGRRREPPGFDIKKIRCRGGKTVEKKSSKVLNAPKGRWW